ncbi:DUF262 domain-containing protein, partial [uncultured Megasphaera sp.]|uniref:DUF262 domain-containing protein n=1 Tax=uncultured Megasphaera sp. TaxID=165188 RepID=UPI0025F8D027
PLMAIQSATQESMKTFLNNIYYIPTNQREYSWEQEQLEDFWEDLKSVIENQDRTHFFGQIVIYDDNKKKKKYIIDGQQRTITSMIFLRAMQYICQQIAQATENDEEKGGLQDIVASITQNVLGQKANKWDNSSRLHLTFESELEENDYFADNIISQGPSKDKIKNNAACENMRNAYQYFYDQIKACIGPNDINGKIEALYRIRNQFWDNFMVMYLETNDAGEAYVIFETLNARGKELETADLLKNYVFSQAGENIKNVQDKWKSIADTLSGMDLTKYIRYYWNAHYNLVREKDLYREMSATIKTPKDSADLVTRLNNYAVYYHDAMNPESCEGYEDSTIIHHLRNLKTLKATSYIPILISLEMKGRMFTDSDKATVLQAIEVYVFRNATISGKTANTTEKFFSTIAKQIYDEKLTTASDIAAKIKSEMISDEDFYNNFRTFKTKTQQYVRYILLTIHETHDKNHEINRNFNNVNIEHIMPKTLTPAWKTDKAIHEKYLWRLGNMALLDETLNKKISNQPFEEKKKRYHESQIFPNTELTKYAKWTAKEIEDRQKYLADLALQIWK